MNIKNLVRLVSGLFLYAVGIVFTIQASLGVTPWNTFHQGIALLTGISLGQALSLTGLAIIILNVFAKEKIGVGTILNMWLIGIFVDFIMKFSIIPNADSLISGLFMIVIGMFTIATASWLYIGSELGAGPRDGLMVTLVRWTGKPVGLVRGSIELTVLILGTLLGGQFGIGTPIMAFLIGPIVQLTFKVFRFDVKNVEHQYLTLPASIKSVKE